MEAQGSSLGCGLRADATAEVLHAGAEVLLSCSGFKFESNFMVKDVQATRDQRHITDMVALQSETS